MIQVVAGLVFRDGRLLITRRPPGTHLAGHWEFPGGKLDPGEDWLPALHRELREELAIEIRAGPLVEDLVHVYPEKQVRLRFYQCRWQAGEPQTLGCDALVWVRPDELDGYPFPAADARLLDRLRTEPHWWGI